MPATESTAAPDPAELGASMAGSMPPVTGGGSAPAAAPASAPSTPAPSAAPAASPEVDAKGRPFDPEKFLHKKDKNENWIPRSPGRYGRNGEKRPKTPPNPSPSQPGHGTEADLFSSPSSRPASPASSAQSSPPAGGGSYIPPETDLPPPGGASATGAVPAPGARSAADPAAEPVGSADDAADVGCRALYSIVGGVTGAPEEAEPTAKEHEHLRKTLAAYLRARGIETRGGWAVLLAFGRWFLTTQAKPRTRAWVASLFAKKRGEPRPVVDIAPAAAPVRPAEPAPAAPPAPMPPSEKGPAAYALNLPRR